MRIGAALGQARRPTGGPNRRNGTRRPHLNESRDRHRGRILATLGRRARPPDHASRAGSRRHRHGAPRRPVNPFDHRQARRGCGRGRTRVGALAPGRLRAVARSRRAGLVELQEAGDWQAPTMPAHYARHQLAARGAVAKLRYQAGA